MFKNELFLQRIVCHPDYDISRKKNDIALIEFEGDVEFDGSVHPACVRTDANEVPEDVELTVAGWGSIEANRMYNLKNHPKSPLKKFFNFYSNVQKERIYQKFC